ncbi:MAG: DUF5597 domain-containing protein [Treponema sp.]|jgi:hypothetical protein|nr:DUF5597 domain-containing protein [Treponema sp.]
MKKFEGFTMKGKPFFPLGAQAHNSSSYSREMFAEACKAALALNCNTVEAPIYWEKIEKREGDFDFSSIDFMLECCRINGLALVLLWFGSWKNGDISYAPEWVKRDQNRFRRVLRSDGIPVADLSAHYPANREADAKAFAAVCSYLNKTNAARETVIAVQVENEPGYLRTDRDYSEAALENQKAPVPEKLLVYLESHKEAPAYKDWEQEGKKQGVSWFDSFGFHGFEYCEAWHLALYIDAVAAAGKARHQIPLYINVWLNDGNPWGVPGIEYPGGGAVIRAMHIWLAAVEHIDMLAPDIYEQNCYRYERICDFYGTGENTLFIPESSRNLSSACNMFYAIAGGAAGYAVFGSESCLDSEGNVVDSAVPVRDSNTVVQNVMPLILKHRNTGKLYPVVMHTDQEDQGYEFEDFLGSVHFKTSGSGFFDYSAGREKTTPENMTPRGLIIEDGKRCFYLAGRFSLRLAVKESPEISQVSGYIPCPDFVSVEEGHFDGKGDFITDRIRNGDEAFFGGFWTTPACGVVRVKLL